MTQDLFIIGAGEFGREVQTWAEQAVAAGAPWRLAGFLDERANALDGYRSGLEVIGPLRSYAPRAGDLFLCAISNPATKASVYHAVTAQGGCFATLVHPSAIVGRNVTLGAGVILAPFTQLSCDISIGRLASLGTFTSVAHDVVIGDYAQVSGGCQINGRVQIADSVFLGSHATLLPRARIEAGAYVGAGSVVLRRVVAGARVFGNPASRIDAPSDG